MGFKESEVMDAYKEKVVEGFYDPVRNERYSYFDEGGMLFDSVSSIMEAVSVLEKTPGDIFGSESFRIGGSLILSYDQECVISAALIKYAKIERGMVLFKVNPYVSAFYECYKEIKLSNPHKASWSELPECFDGLNRFVAAVRERISSGAFKRQISAHVRAANKNCSGLLRYIDALFARHSRLLVLRIDFSYGKGGLEIEGVSALRDRLNMLRVVSEKISRHRVELIGYLKNKRAELGMVGFVWKLEYGREKGHHYHMMFFLDGAKVRQDIVIAKRIGEYWNNVITQGKGVYYNCNGDKGKYKYCGVGMISYNDAEGLHNLKKAAVYLAKVDRYISACMPEGKRTFGKGNTPKPSERSAGRPRQY
ncbi:inovirus-type Gp2 protein [Pseudomonas sp. FEN]|uniref:YagK/YfjJ domain-containing protein n=1 Tax=Pseudomonas sp. FEN TaxID=2767468 RepID=UPI001748F067|nr:inovirus-type Gp2 protein [Pseudomonas sp. FEN]